ALRAALAPSGSYRYLGERHVVAVEAHAVLDHLGERHEGDLVVCCPGAHPGGFASEHLGSAPVRRVRIQMLETAPFRGALAPALADGDSLRYYPAYAGAARDALPPQGAVAARWRSQLLCVQRASGHLTVGDTHSYGEPFPFDLAEEPMEELVGTAARLLGSPLPLVERRWAGVYAEVTDGGLYHRDEIAPGVVIVTGAGGRGMTIAPAIAEETFA
ncbi:MAG: FAD-dependent oxidoreductase, partial [Actinomycetota bacterium]|nr:FAD-dependent oxidoreductase [Actinomycetota bacterium]